MPIDELTPDDRYNLAFLCVMTRPNLMVFMTGVDRFVKTLLHKSQIATFLVPEMVSGTPGFMSFEAFSNTTAESSKDARNVVPPSGGYRAPSEPLTAGAFFGRPVLLDGYHRAVSFWRFADQGSAISAYLPLQFVSAA